MMFMFIVRWGQRNNVCAMHTCFTTPILLPLSACFKTRSCVKWTKWRLLLYWKGVLATNSRETQHQSQSMISKLYSNPGIFGIFFACTSSQYQALPLHPSWEPGYEASILYSNTSNDGPMYMYRLFPNLSAVHSIGYGWMAPLTTCNIHTLLYSVWGV